MILINGKPLEVDNVFSGGELNIKLPELDLKIGSKGATFIELAKIIKPMNPGSMTLFVTHGIFRNGTDCLFEAGFDRVITTDSLPQTQQNHKGEFHVFKI